MTKLGDLADQLRDLADKIAERGDDELVDGSLSLDEPGTVLVFDEACNAERLALNLSTLVDELLDDPDLSGYEPALREWARLLAELSMRIEARLKSDDEDDE